MLSKSVCCTYCTSVYYLVCFSKSSKLSTRLNIFVFWASVVGSALMRRIIFSSRLNRFAPCEKNDQANNDDNEKNDKYAHQNPRTRTNFWFFMLENNLTMLSRWPRRYGNTVPIIQISFRRIHSGRSIVRHVRINLPFRLRMIDGSIDVIRSIHGSRCHVIILAIMATMTPSHGRHFWSSNNLFC